MAWLQSSFRLYRHQKEKQMSTASKIITGTVIGAGVIAGIKYFSGLMRAQVQLQIIPTIHLHSINLQGLVVRVDALLKNPSNASFKIKYPFIQIMHKDTLIGSSQAINKDIHIPAYGQVLIKDMMVDIPSLNFLSLITDLILSLNNNEPVLLNVGVITTIKLGWTEMAYEHRQDLTLKK